MQVSLADETEANKTVEEREEEDKKAEEVAELDEENMTDEEIEKIGFTPPEGFVDEVCVLDQMNSREVVSCRGRSIFWCSGLYILNESAILV